MANCRKYSKQDFAGLREAGKLAAHILDYITPFVQAGVTTAELDHLCHEEILRNDAIPAPLGYNGYPKATCISLNHVICHGIPSARKLVKGDILNIDITVILDGWYGDTSRMYIVGKPSAKAMELIDVTYNSLMMAIEAVKPGIKLGDIGHIIQSYAEENKFSVVRDYCGHGIGRVFHDEPMVLHYGKPDTGLTLEVGNVFTIEPMINVGGYKSRLLGDGWTAITADHSLSAQFEHTIGVTENGCEIFTESPMGLTKPPYGTEAKKK
ncbi:MAG: type I methionyl aminopeptidase [Alphaproteobacteria bacterium]|nr:type I methionyl aminopeptidase [Alphaproteobacteria bacterium]MBO7536939.1 type I methionyl aminopeptidase [Alphaproteobacteria bacterium]MBO7642001.1 type I methionyl aminopeptidase [Alphaproteobacteria bacterium]